MIKNLLESILQRLALNISKQADEIMVDENDPFNQFMMDQTEKNEKEEVKDHFHLLQSLRSLSTLLMTSQMSIDGTIELYQGYTGLLARVIQEFQKHENQMSMKNHEITGQVFRFYNTEVIRVFQHESRDDLETSVGNSHDMVFQYI